jgi:hypothetical protein
MGESRGGSAWYVWLVGIALLLAAAWFFTPLPMFVGIFWSTSHVRRIEARMQQAEVYLPVATNLALYCQSSEVLQFTNIVGASRLPQPLPSLGSPWASFKTNYAHVEFGGGFYHYGYRVQLDQEASSPQGNIWELYLCREGQAERLLHRFALPPTACVAPSAFTSNSVAEYDRRLSKSPTDLALHKAKISLLLQYNPDQARLACLDAVKALPQHWWPRLTMALLDTGKRNPSGAAQELVKFVEAKPSYSRYLYLAYSYQMTEKPKDAALAIEKAISFPIVDLDDDENNTECRGYSAGVYAFRSREYSTVVKLCNALLPIKENGNYAKAALRELKSAAEAAMAGSDPEFTPSEAVLGFNPYERIDVRALLSK